MICPSCKSEYREGFNHCPDCDIDLVWELKEVPRLAPLTLETSGELIAELVDRLEKDGIPYAIEAGTALPLLDDPLADVGDPQEWMARVWVAKKLESDAQEILEELRHERRLGREGA